MRYGIIVAGYNREKSLQRILDRLGSCYYGKEEITLIVSLDFSGNSTLKRIADDFQWNYGEKIVKAYEKNLGLRSHILRCGNYMNDYDIDAVAVFEDDIYPSKSFFTYMENAIDFYKDDDSIAGISLYSHQWNTSARCPFEPYKTEDDTFFMQFAQSWGQVWLRKWWNSFYEWYLNNANFTADELLPDFVNSWPESSWLKYHIRYCVEKNKYFVYPYISYTTCFADVGEHTKRQDTLLQVRLQEGVKEKFCFSKLDKSAVVYDAFFERIIYDNIDGIAAENICVDLYQTKRNRKERYILTTEILDYKIIHSYGLRLRPQEANVIDGLPGENIFLYDSTVRERHRKSRRRQSWDVYKYRNKIGADRRLLKDTIAHILSFW